MIRDVHRWRQFEDQRSREEGRLPYDRALLLFEAMWQEAVAFGVLPGKDPLEGIDADIRVAKILNSCLKKPSSE